MKYLLSWAFLLMAQLLVGQCFTDRHNTSLSSTWMSCEISPNPNANRGDSHWISYDLGEVKKLGKSHFWNINNPAELESGARQIAISVSEDGQSWDELGIWEAAMADASGFYEGQEGYDFDGVEARFVLLTILNSHGGDCVGFAEIKIEAKDPTGLAEVEDEAGLIKIHPNPASDMAYLSFLSKTSGLRTLQVTDITGRIVYAEEIHVHAGEQQVPLTLEAMDSGSYIVRLIGKSSEQQAELTIIKN